MCIQNVEFVLMSLTVYSFFIETCYVLFILRLLTGFLASHCPLRERVFY